MKISRPCYDNVEKRLLWEAESFAEDLAHIDQEAFVVRVIKALGISLDRATLESGASRDDQQEDDPATT
jgi:hypothetical protein